MLSGKRSPKQKSFPKMPIKKHIGMYFFAKASHYARSTSDGLMWIETDFFPLITHFRAILGLRGRDISQYSISISSVPLQQHFCRTAIDVFRLLRGSQAAYYAIPNREIFRGNLYHHLHSLQNDPYA